MENMNTYQSKLEKISDIVQEEYDNRLYDCFICDLDQLYRPMDDYNGLSYLLDNKKMGRRKRDRLIRQCAKCENLITFYKSFHSTKNHAGSGMEGGNRAYAIFRAHIIAFSMIKELCRDFNLNIRLTRESLDVGEEIARSCNDILMNLEKDFPFEMNSRWNLPIRRIEYSSLSDDNPKFFRSSCNGHRKRM